MRALWWTLGRSCVDQSFSSGVINASSRFGDDTSPEIGSQIYDLIRPHFAISRYEAGEINRLFTLRNLVQRLQNISQNPPTVTFSSEELQVLGLCCMDEGIRTIILGSSSANLQQRLALFNLKVDPPNAQAVIGFIVAHHGDLNFIDKEGWRQPRTTLCEPGVTEIVNTVKYKHVIGVWPDIPLGASANDPHNKDFVSKYALDRGFRNRLRDDLRDNQPLFYEQARFEMFLNGEGFNVANWNQGQLNIIYNWVVQSVRATRLETS